MNTRPTRPTGPVSEQEWRAQEQALSAPARRADVLLARALRTTPVPQPPPGFAAEVAALAAARPRAATADDGRVERALLHGLLAVLAMSTLVVLAWFGGQWWDLARGALGAQAVQLSLLGAACLLLSWLPGAARRLIHEAQASPV